MDQANNINALIRDNRDLIRQAALSSRAEIGVNSYESLAFHTPNIERVLRVFLSVLLRCF